MEMAMAEGDGLDGRTSRRPQQFRCECDFFVKLCFHHKVQHGHLCPQVLIRLVCLSWRIFRLSVQLTELRLPSLRAIL